MFVIMAAARTASAQEGSGSVTAVQSDEFHVGDRIALTIEGPPSPVVDTVVVRDGLIIRLPNMGDISLKGVRRAEAQTYLTREIAKYVKNAVVHATPLLRIGVLGAVMKPGYYSVPSDMLLTDALMWAGGPVPGANVNGSVIRRGDKKMLDDKQVQNALASGKTLDQLRMASGDQVVVPQAPTRKLSTILQISGAVVGLAGLVLALSRR
jgi:polysaccharide export outer membrane protein